MEPFFDVCILTNGRSSFEYCVKSISEQTMPVKIHIIEDMSMENAMNYITHNDKMKRFVLKVDDDFILHSRAIEFLNQCSKWPSNCAMKFWHLDDIATGRIIQCVKIYDRLICKDIGGFRANEQGKVDRTFIKDIAKHKLVYKSDPSVIAIHACNPKEDQIRYEELWKSNAPSGSHSKGYREQMLNCNYSLDIQFDNRDKTIFKRNNIKNSFKQYIIDKDK